MDVAKIGKIDRLILIIFHDLLHLWLARMFDNMKIGKLAQTVDPGGLPVQLVKQLSQPQAFQAGYNEK